MDTDSNHVGRLQRAPENFLSAKDIAAVAAGRRSFLKKSFAAAGASLATGASVNTLAADAGDPAILTLPEYSKTLGKPVAANSYGVPSKYEHNLQRRESPGLTRVSAASRPCRACSESSRRMDCISSAIIRAGSTSIQASIA